jgi:hypothetical protein
MVFFIFFFDALFFISLYAAASLFDTFFLQYQAMLIGSWKGIVSLLIYFLVVIFAYCFFKFCVLHFVAFLLGEKRTLNFERFKGFYIFNVILILVSLTSFLLIVMGLFISLEELFKIGAIQLCVVVFTAGFYLFIQTSHTVYFESKAILLKDIPKKVISLLEVKELGSLLLWNLGFVLLFAVVFALLGFFMEHAGEQALASQGWGIIFFGANIVMVLYLFLVSYFFLFWNRLYLFTSMRKQLK